MLLKRVLVTLTTQEFEEIKKYVGLQSPHMYQLVQVSFFEDGTMEIKNV